MGIIVIVAYKPLEGQSDALDALMKDHVPILRGEGLVTDRTPIIMRAADGTYVEVFEWVSAEAIHTAHANPVVLAMWERYGKCCTYEKIGDVPEAHDLFSSFTPVN